MPPDPAGDLGELLRALRRRGAVTVTFGSSRDIPSLRATERLTRTWTALGGQALDLVTWPDTAASWLRQARRFTAHSPDAWIVVTTPAGWAGMTARLAALPWDPDRTIVRARPATDHSGGASSVPQLAGRCSVSSEGVPGSGR